MQCAGTPLKVLLNMSITGNFKITSPDSQDAVLVGNVRDGPVVADGEAPESVPEVIITAPLGLDALGL